MYGCELYRKNSYVVRYNFYKNFIYALPQFVFGIFSGWTGAPVYDTYLSQLYNLLYTSLPIVLFSLFDTKFEEQELLNNEHHTYQTSRTGAYFSITAIFLTLAEAVTIAVVGSYMLFVMIPLIYVSPNDLDIMESSVIVMFWIVVVVNVVLLLHIRHTSMNMLMNGLVTVALYVASIKVVGMLSLDIRFSFEPIMTLKGMSIVVGCSCLSLAISQLFDAFEERYLSSFTYTDTPGAKYNMAQQLLADNSGVAEYRQ